MTEEKNGVTNGEAPTEMAPQEDGTKVPLTNDAGAEVKLTASDPPPNGDAKVEMEPVPTFSGLSKDDLMKYSNDPFWVRLRWFLFIMFWAGWLAMLIVAIVIIVQAPRCAPKETLEWIQESAMVNYDVNDQFDVDGVQDVTPQDMVELAKKLGVNTVYMKDLISPKNFEEINEIYTAEDIQNLLEKAMVKDIQVVTDFIPTQVGPDNNWFNNPNMSDFFEPNSGILDFSNTNLLEKLQEVLRDSWISKGVLGFLMAQADTDQLVGARTYLNSALEDVNGAVVSGVADMQNELVSGFDAGMYRKFLDEHVNKTTWSYYKYNPHIAEGSIPNLVHLVTMSLFLVPGTPVLDGFSEAYVLKNKTDIIRQLSMLREKESVQVGGMTFSNTTSDDVIAFARLPILKGTPGYAVAINMHSDNSTVVDFTSIEGVPDKGEVHLISTWDGMQTDSANLEKKEMGSITLAPLEGIIMQFVPSF